jgi:hypothetical protein
MRRQPLGVMVRQSRTTSRLLGVGREPSGLAATGARVVTSTRTWGITSSSRRRNSSPDESASSPSRAESLHRGSAVEGVRSPEDTLALAGLDGET